MTQTQGDEEMNTNENTRTNAPDDIIVLGVASVETKGGGMPGGEELGENVLPGISEQ